MPGPELFTFICGTAGSDPRYNPPEVFGRHPLAAAILLFVNEHPASTAEIAHHLSEVDRPGPGTAPGHAPNPVPGHAERGEVEAALEALLGLGAVRLEDGRFWANMPVFTAADRIVIRQVTGPYAASLARGIAARRDRLAAMIRAMAVEAPLGDLLFFVAGCFGLDWGGLSVLEAAGYSSPGREYPDGGRFIPFAEEVPVNGEGFKAKEYNGSHTGRAGGYTFLTFGDHSGWREALPDAAWGRADGDRFMAGCGEILARLAAARGRGARENGPGDGGVRSDDAGAECLSFLERTSYVNDGRVIVPFLPADAADAAAAATRAVQMVIDEWARAEIRNLEISLGGLSSLKNRVPVAEVINQVWHSLFGETNRLLAESGFMTDPPLRRPGLARYLALAGEDRFFDALYAAIPWSR